MLASNPMQVRQGAYDNGTAAAEAEASTLASVDRDRRLRILQTPVGILYEVEV